MKKLNLLSKFGEIFCYFYKNLRYVEYILFLYEYNIVNLRKSEMIIMLLIKAVDYRILELCKAYNLSINGLANKAGMPPSTVASLLSEKSRNPTEDTIFKICIGFGMRMDKFYASNLFDLKNISLENTSQKIYKV